VSRARGSLWKPILAAAATALAVAALGGWMTDLGPWYYGLRMPSWKPPDWLFGPAWTLIYSLTAMAGVLAWRGAPTMRGRALVLALFAININLNVLWSGLFFRQQRPDYALIEVVVLWLSIVALIVGVRRYSEAASLLLVPYLLWVTFAGALNAAVVRLNAPFGGP
jgi:tryptophan-rich sensory protein